MTEIRQHNKITLAGFLITLIGAILFSTKAIIVKTAFNKIHIDALPLLTSTIIEAHYVLGEKIFTEQIIGYPLGDCRCFTGSLEKNVAN